MEPISAGKTEEAVKTSAPPLAFEPIEPTPADIKNPLWDPRSKRFEVYVDARLGNDAAEGSAGAPVRTIERAQQIVRKLLLGTHNHIVVQLLPGGVHALNRSLVFNPEDGSQTADQTITYQGFNGQIAEISGERTISNWSPVDLAGRDNVFRATYRGPMFRQLHFGESMGTRSRHPNFGTAGTAHPRIRRWAPKARKFTIDPLKDRNNNALLHQGLIGAHHLGKPEVHVVGDGNILILRVAEVEQSSDELIITPMNEEREVAFFQGFGSNDRADIYFNGTYPAVGPTDGPLIETNQYAHAFWLENSMAFLDAPGEWFAHPLGNDTYEVYVIPPAGVDLAKTQVKVPGSTDTLVTMIGTPEKRVKNIRFQNIRFSHTNYLHRYFEDIYMYLARRDLIPSNYVALNNNPSTQGYVGKWSGFPILFENIGDKRIPRYGHMDPAAVYLLNTEGIHFHSNIFENIEAGAIQLYRHHSNVRIEGNVFLNVGSFGIMAYNPTGDLAPVAPYKIEGLKIANNIFTSMGFRYNGVPITVIENDHNNVSIENNEFRNLPFYGIQANLGGPQMFIRKNRLTGTMNVFSDGGAIMISNLTRAPVDGNMEITENFISDIAQKDWIRRVGKSEVILSGIYVDGGRAMLLGNNYMKDVRIGISMICLHRDFRILSNYIESTAMDVFDNGCPTDGKFNLHRPEPLVPLTPANYNNQESWLPRFDQIREDSGPTPEWKVHWKRYL